MEVVELLGAWREEVVGQEHPLESCHYQECTIRNAGMLADLSFKTNLSVIILTVSPVANGSSSHAISKPNVDYVFGFVD